jgi:hypothetical protein
MVGIESCPGTLCVDCAIECRPWELFMVTDELWHQAGDVQGYLCVGCLEDRIGRDLASIRQ